MTDFADLVHPLPRPKQQLRAEPPVKPAYSLGLVWDEYGGRMPVEGTLDRKMKDGIPVYFPAEE